MFFFKKKQPTPKYMVFMHRVGKFKWVANALKSAQPDGFAILIYFFEETRDNMKRLLDAAEIAYQSSSGDTLLSSGIHLIDGRSLQGKHLPNGSKVMVLEVHPMKSINDIPLIAGKENKVSDMIYYSGIDEAVMTVFGGERLQQLMGRMGMDEDEPIEHAMVSKSIDRAVKKVEQETTHHQNIRSSQEDWLSANKK